MTRTRALMRIVVMGTDERLNEVLLRNLCQWGYEATAWEGGVCEEAADGDLADVLLVDLDGIEQRLLDGVAQQDPEDVLLRPAARLTIALGSQPLRRKTLEALEAVLFVPKPFDMGVLRGYLITLGRVLGGATVQPRVFLAPEEPLRVLVADDDSRLTELACAMLSKHGRYVVRAARDGLEVLEQCVTWEPDCLVMDMMMPRMNGYQVLRCLQARSGSALLPVVVLSALAEIEVRAEELKQPSLTVVKKPLRSADLLAAVERALSIPLAEGSRRSLQVG